MDVTKGDLGNLTFSFGINLAVLYRSAKASGRNVVVSLSLMGNSTHKQLKDKYV